MLFTLALFLVAAFAGVCPGSDLGNTDAANMAKLHDYCSCAAIAANNAAGTNACGLMQQVNFLFTENLCAVECHEVTAQTHICSEVWMGANCAVNHPFTDALSTELPLDDECKEHASGVYTNILRKKAFCADASCTIGCTSLADNNGSTAGTHNFGDCHKIDILKTPRPMSYMKSFCSLCSTYACPANYDNNGASVTCTTGTCDEATCCTEQSGSRRGRLL